MNKFFVSLLVSFLFFSHSLFSFLGMSVLVENFHKGPLKKATKINNTPWNQWLRTYVRANGLVNYKKGKKDIVKIEKYVKYLLSIDSTSLASKSAQLAYHLNLYNAMIIYGVLRHYPMKSVLKIKGISFFGQTFFYRGKKITLQQLENNKILKKFKEPLVHFALNCASYSCPPLKNKAYIGKGLKRQLIKQTKAYLKNKEFFRVDQKKKTLHVIELFKWYKKDLGNPVKFYKKYGNPKSGLSSSNFRFIPYNWSLNTI